MLERRDRDFAERYGSMFPEDPGIKRRLLGRAEALAAGRAVIVRHGWEVDLPPDSGPFVLESDGTVGEVVPVHADESAPVLTCVGYRRADGSLVER